MLTHLNNKRILVTGASSMIGREVINTLQKRNAGLLYPTHDLLDISQRSEIERFIGKHKPDYIIHLASYNGNLDFNKKYPYDIFFRSSLLAHNLLSTAYSLGVKKVVNILPSCSYGFADSQGNTRDILYEDDFDTSLPHPSVMYHGLARRNTFYLSKALYKQYGFNSVCCVVNNAYGQEKIDLDKTKVVGSLIKKFVNATNNNEKTITLLGDGSPRREFIHAIDVAEGLVRVLEEFDNPNFVLNIGHGLDISIKELAEIIAKLTGFAGEILWGSVDQNGQMKKLLDNTRMKTILKWSPKINLLDGLKMTVDWYKEEIVKLTQRPDFN